MRGGRGAAGAPWGAGGPDTPSSCTVCGAGTPLRGRDPLPLPYSEGKGPSLSTPVGQGPLSVPCSVGQGQPRLSSARRGDRPPSLSAPRSPVGQGPHWGNGAAKACPCRPPPRALWGRASPGLRLFGVAGDPVGGPIRSPLGGQWRPGTAWPWGGGGDRGHVPTQRPPHGDPLCHRELLGHPVHGGCWLGIRHVPSLSRGRHRMLRVSLP